MKENVGSDIFNTLESTYSIAVVDVVSQYDRKDIFVDKKAGDTVINWQYDSANDIYYYQITGMDAEIALNEFILSSKPEHTAFTAALGRPVLEVKISDGTVASSN